MKDLIFSYQSLTRFTAPISNHSFLLRAVPLSNMSQKLLQGSFILSEPVTVNRSVDCWHNDIQYGFAPGLHSSFGYVESGIVRICGNVMVDRNPSPLFSVHTSLTNINDSMICLVDKVSGDNFSMACAIATNVYQYMEYVSGSTSAVTTALQAFEQKQGVCQDFAHILISLCRYKKIPARYVCGLVKGEGKTHAWTEIWSDGVWYGIDPTSETVVSDAYIKIASGRDASDCSVSRGVFCGDVGQTTDVKVFVEEL